jgi:uncharacterized protein (TIGR00730 family)
MKRVCVFCESYTGADPVYENAAREIAATMVSRGLGVVYGGGRIGLMGVVADTALAAGGEVIGVIPRPLASKELAHTGLTEMKFVASMHERKATMSALADGFVTLPGGLGTLEETFEILTWAQLGIQRKPIGILNVNGYYDPFLRLFEHGIREGFIRGEYRGFISVAETGPALLDAMTAWTPPPVAGNWLDSSQT